MKKPFVHRLSSLFLTLALLLSLFSPVQAVETGEEPPAPVEAEVVLNHTQLAVTMGVNASLTAFVTPEGVTVGDWSWASSEVTVVRVEADATDPSTALITPVSPGRTAVVTVTASRITDAAGNPLPDLTASCEVVVQFANASNISMSVSTIRLDPGKTQDLSAIVMPTTADPTNVKWETSSESVVTVAPTTGRTVAVTAVGPGLATITATALSGNQTGTCSVTVPGILLTDTEISLVSGGNQTVGTSIYGEIGTSVEWTSTNETVAQVAGGRITARGAGTATITATVAGSNYSASCLVKVIENTAGIIEVSGTAGQPVEFSTLTSELDSECRSVLGYPLSYVAALSVSTTDGVLYYGYVSADDTGAGVGAENYYYTGGGIGDRSLKNVSFVPNVDFTGTTADISYTGYATNGAFFKGTIRVEVDKASAVTYSGSGGNPIHFQAENFNSICRARNGRDLDYVIFSLPTSSRGTLYYNYTGNALDTKVTDGAQYFRASNPKLDSVTFVPASGFSGSVSIQYSARDTQGFSYVGRVLINVTASGEAGDVTYSVDHGDYVTFEVSDFNTVCKDATGDSLQYVRFDLPSSSQGTLYYSYSSSGSYDSKVTDGKSYYRNQSPYLSRISFVPKSGYDGTVKINFTASSTEGDKFNGVVSITVGGNGSAGSIDYYTAKGKALEFDVDDFNRACRNETGYNLDYVRFTLPSSSRGTLYYNYYSSGNYDSKVSSTRSYYRDSSYYLDDVSFVPYSSYTGTVDIDYTGWDVKGNRFNGTVSIRVGGSSSSDGTIEYSTSKNKPITFDDGDFNDLAREENGYSLKYVQFTLPSSSKGTLYYNYTSSGNYDSKVTNSKSYYRSSSPYLENVTFVPASGYTGTVDIDFIGYDTDGNRFRGTVSIRVGGSSSSGTIDYSTAKNTPITFDDDDFNQLAREENGYSLKYVQFTTPSSSKGTLYYNYKSSGSYDSKVTNSKSYYRSSSPYLENVTFVPASGYTGTVDIDFTGYDTDGNRLTGTVSIRVGGSSSGSTISYSTARNKPITFVVSDFNDLARGKNGYSLNYVQFSTPSSSKGTLYYNYKSSGSYDSKVTNSKSYYRSSSPYLENVTFVPASGYTGTVDISFTGYDTDGNRFTGTVEIKVGSGSSSGNGIHYSVASGKSVTFDDTDFNDLSRSERGVSLSYVRFDLPSSSKGTLYYNYTSSSKYDSKVSDSRSYYRSSSPYLSSITFVPASGYTGTVSIDFTGYDTSGGKFTGTVDIEVTQGATASIIAYTTGTAPVTFRANDFRSACAARGEGSFVSAVFSPPSSSTGRLYYGYKGPNETGSEVSALLSYTESGNYSLSNITFVPKAYFSGTVAIPYQAKDSNGVSYSGTVQVVVTPPTKSSHFVDMDGYSWAAPAVDYLYDNQVTTGSSGQRYLPASQITRGDFILMLCKALDLSSSGGSGFQDVPSSRYYAEAVRTAQGLGIATGDGSRFYPERSLTRQDACVFLEKALQAAGRSVPAGGDSVLDRFTDRSQIASYASSAMAAMVQLGILQGGGDGQLSPVSALSRAEMAVMLYHAMTL